MHNSSLLGVGAAAGKKPYGLIEWILWAMLMLGVVALFFFAVIFAGTNSFLANAIIYGTLILVAAVTIFQSLIAAIGVQKEAKLSSIQAKRLIDGEELSDVIATAKPSLFKSHIQNLYSIMKSDPTISQDTLLVLMQNKLLARNQQSKLFAGILVTIGLIGTIAGLIQMTAKMRMTLSDFDSDKTDELVGSLFQAGGALSGLDTAFYTTLVGATLGGVVLRILAGVIEKNISILISDVAELSEVYVLPALRSTAKELDLGGYYTRRLGGEAPDE